MPAGCTTKVKLHQETESEEEEEEENQGEGEGDDDEVETVDVRLVKKWKSRHLCTLHPSQAARSFFKHHFYLGILRPVHYL